MLCQGQVKKLKICEGFGMGLSTEGVECGMVQWVKYGTLRLFGHVMRIN